jgi:hypothetical protein
MSLTKLSLAGNNLCILSRESLVSNIPAEDGKIGTLFYSVRSNILTYHAVPRTSIPFSIQGWLPPLPLSTSTHPTTNTSCKCFPPTHVYVQNERLAIHEETLSLRILIFLRTSIRSLHPEYQRQAAEKCKNKQTWYNLKSVLYQLVTSILKIK